MIFNVTGGGGTGGTLVVTAPAGVTCTVSKDGKTKVKTVDQYGYATFKGLDTGTWTVTISDGSQTSPARQVVVTTDYDVTMSFFSASIAVTYPEGSTCTCSDGSTTLTAPDTSGSYTFQVPNAGTWTVSCTDGSDTDSIAVTITTDGESQSVELTYKMLYYKGEEYTHKTGGWDVTNGSKNSDNIELRVTSTGSGSPAGTATHVNPVDLTDKNSVSVHMIEAKSTTSPGSVNIKIKNTSGSYVATTNVITGSNSCSDATFNVDVSALEGSYYVEVVATTGNAASGRTAYAIFDEVSCT